jgi:hypothetical protein
MNGRWAILAVPGLALGPAAAARPVPPLVAIEAPYIPIFCQPRKLAADFGSFGRIHTARRGELIVPPHDYASRRDPDPRDPDIGHIYDIAFLTVDDDGIMLEVRVYSGGDLTLPRISRTVSSPVGVATIRLRNIILHIKAATALRLTYGVEIDPAAVEDAGDSDSSGETEKIAPDHCRHDMMDIVEPPSQP